MNPSDPLDNTESSLLSAFRLLRTFTLSKYSFKIITCCVVDALNVQTLKPDCRPLDCRLLRVFTLPVTQWLDAACEGLTSIVVDVLS
jgi:hypothetical protein